MVGKFILNLLCETIDRPVDNVTLFVYAGNPTDLYPLKLGNFVTTTYAYEDHYIEMKQEYFGTNPSIYHLVKYLLSEIVIAVLNDMRYDFILTATQWDSKKQRNNG